MCTAMTVGMSPRAILPACDKHYMEFQIHANFAFFESWPAAVGSNSKAYATRIVLMTLQHVAASLNVLHVLSILTIFTGHDAVAQYL